MKPYFLCKLGSVTRVSDRCSTPAEAAKDCFGVVRGVVCLEIRGKAWRYLPTKERQVYHNLLEKAVENQNRQEQGKQETSQGSQ